jgi:hypothetical protein
MDLFLTGRKFPESGVATGVLAKRSSDAAISTSIALRPGVICVCVFSPGFNPIAVAFDCVLDDLEGADALFISMTRGLLVFGKSMPDFDPPDANPGG